MKKNNEFYVTTFCNFAHRLHDGKPIEHECYILNPKALALEAKEGAQAVLDAHIPVRTNTIMRRGIKGGAQ